MGGIIVGQLPYVPQHSGNLTSRGLKHLQEVGIAGVYVFDLGASGFPQDKIDIRQRGLHFMNMRDLVLCDEKSSDSDIGGRPAQKKQNHSRTKCYLCPLLRRHIPDPSGALIRTGARPLQFEPLVFLTVLRKMDKAVHSREGLLRISPVRKCYNNLAYRKQVSFRSLPNRLNSGISLKTISVSRAGNRARTAQNPRFELYRMYKKRSEN